VSGRDRESQPEGSTVADVMEARWGVRASSAVARLGEPGWSYDKPVPTLCPGCGSSLHCLRKPYESAGKQYRYVALVCPRCPAAFTLADLGFKTYEQMATPIHADTAVPDMWQAARARGLTDPDWITSSRPARCHLDDIAYTTLLRDRSTGCTLDVREDPPTTWRPGIPASAPGAARVSQPVAQPYRN
jgi:hypothetical protein